MPSLATTYVRFASGEKFYPNEDQLGGASAANYRHATNAQPKVELTDINPLPD